MIRGRENILDSMWISRPLLPFSDDYPLAALEPRGVGVSSLRVRALNDFRLDIHRICLDSCSSRWNCKEKCAWLGGAEISALRQKSLDTRDNSTASEGLRDKDPEGDGSGIHRPARSRLLALMFLCAGMNGPSRPEESHDGERLL